MRLSDFFMGEKSISDAGKMQQNSIGRNDSAVHKIPSLTAGQTIRMKWWRETETK